jgi:hypothetical protein
MDLTKISLDELKAFILLVLTEFPNILSADSPIPAAKSPFRKCVCIWDYLKYRDEALKHIEELKQEGK